VWGEAVLDYSEKRDFIRMPAHCPARLRSVPDNATDEMAELLDLSASGVFSVSTARNAGQRLLVTVTPHNPITRPLQAAVSVVRCEAINNGSILRHSSICSNHRFSCLTDRLGKR
jgi:hypothetical protein